MSETVMNLQKAIVTALARAFLTRGSGLSSIEMQEQDGGLTEDRLL
jgi:hypothetical protein